MLVHNPPSSDSIVDDFMYGNNVASAHIYVRLGFLRKVYGILSAQLALTTVIAGLMMTQKDVLFTYFHAHPWPIFVALFASFGLIVAMHLKKHETPINYILLFAFTLVESLMVGFIVIHYSVAMVIQAFILTAAVTVGLTLFTFQSKRDYSHWGGALFSLLWILIIGGIMQIFLQSPLMHLLMSLGGALLFSLFIVFDTAMIMKRVSPEDYIPACIDLYLDIINLFIYILRILQEMRRE